MSNSNALFQLALQMLSGFFIRGKINLITQTFSALIAETISNKVIADNDDVKRGLMMMSLTLLSLQLKVESATKL